MNSIERRRRDLLLAFIASFVLVNAAILVALRIHELRRTTLLSMFILEPGIDIGRWFLPLVRGSEFAEIAVVGSGSVLFYWGAFWFALTLIPERRRIRRSATLLHSVYAILIGAAAAAVAWRLGMASPRLLGVFGDPVGWLYGLALILLPVPVDPRNWSWRHVTALRLASGCVGYGVVAYLALYWFVWRKGDRA